jgi:hypothetical protein
VRNSKRSHEGYLMIDHRACGGKLQEVATITCSHCSVVMIKNPLRERERAYCPKCDHYICDNCKAVSVMQGGACKTVKQAFDETAEALARAQQRGIITFNNPLCKEP